jgi:hypothetical protein
MGVKIGAAVLAAIGGFMLADVIGHPAGTKAAGGVITRLWTTSAQARTWRAIRSRNRLSQFFNAFRQSGDQPPH